MHVQTLNGRGDESAGRADRGRRRFAPADPTRPRRARVGFSASPSLPPPRSRRWSQDGTTRIEVDRSPHGTPTRHRPPSSEVCSGNRTHFTRALTGDQAVETRMAARSSAQGRRRPPREPRRARGRATPRRAAAPTRSTASPRVRTTSATARRTDPAARPPRASSTTWPRWRRLSPASARTFCRSSIAQYASSATRSSPAARTARARVQGRVVEREVDGVRAPEQHQAQRDERAPPEDDRGDERDDPERGEAHADHERVVSALHQRKNGDACRARHGAGSGG